MKRQQGWKETPLVLKHAQRCCKFNIPPVSVKAGSGIEDHIQMNCFKELTSACSQAWLRLHRPDCLKTPFIHTKEAEATPPASQIKKPPSQSACECFRLQQLQKMFWESQEFRQNSLYKSSATLPHEPEPILKTGNETFLKQKPTATKTVCFYDLKLEARNKQ